MAQSGEAPPPQELLLVDYENVQQLDFTSLSERVTVVVFVGASQKALPIELVASAQHLGERVKWQSVEGGGSNALDFHIACHLGRIFETLPQAVCTVLSKDKGFDPLLRHLRKLGLKCRRVDTWPSPSKKPLKDGDPCYLRVVEVLGKSATNRPRKRTTLSQHIAAIFQKKIAQSDIDRIIDTLIARGMIAEADGTISYAF